MCMLCVSQQKGESLSSRSSLLRKHMAGSSSQPVICPRSQGQTWLSHGPTSNYHSFNHLVSRGGIGRLSRCCCTFNFRLRKSKTAAFSVMRNFGVTTEEDHEFVKALRESQPYVSVHRGRLFVLLISAELVASPYFNPILKVTTYHLSLSLQAFFFFT